MNKNNISIHNKVFTGNTCADFKRTFLKLINHKWLVNLIFAFSTLLFFQNISVGQPTNYLVSISGVDEEAECEDPFYPVYGSQTQEILVNNSWLTIQDGPNINSSNRFTDFPQSFKLTVEASSQESSTRTATETVNFTPGTYTYFISEHTDLSNCNFGFYAVDLDIIIDDPIKITGVKLLNSLNAEIGSSYGCENEVSKVRVKISSFYKHVAAGWTNDYKLQVKGNDNNWHTLPYSISNTGTPIDVSMSNILQYLDYGKRIVFRTIKKQIDGINAIEYSTEYVYVFPEFKFNNGGTIVVEPPNCFGETPIIKIPTSTTGDYIITVSWTAGQGYNFNSNSLTYSGGYYIINNNTPYYNDACSSNCFPDFLPNITYTIDVEHATVGDYNTTYNSNITPCPATTTFTVPEVPPFEILSYTYGFNETDNDGNDVQIAKRGTEGIVKLVVEGSRNSSIEIIGGGKTITANLSNSYKLDEITYYKGIVNASYKAGTYSIYVKNTNCTSNTIGVELNQPAPIDFNTSTNTISCHTTSIDGNEIDGKIIISNISGGIGGLSNYIFSPAASKVGENYEISGLTYNSSGYTVTVSDIYGNNTPHSGIIIPQNSALNFSVGNETAPTMNCLFNGTATASGASGGVPGEGYLYSKYLDSGYDMDTKVEGYSSIGLNNMYLKDSYDCIVSRPVNIPNAPALISISPANRTTTKPSCYNYNDATYTAIVSNVLGTLTVTNTGLYIAPEKISINENTIEIIDLYENTYTLEIKDTYGGQSCSITETFTILPKAQMSITSLETPVSDKGTLTGETSLTLSTENTGTKTYYLYNSDLTLNNSKTSSTDNVIFDGLGGVYENGGLQYYVEVVDENGCSYNEDHSEYYQFKIQEPFETLQLEVEISDSVDCNGYNNGTVTLGASGGWTQLSYEFSDNNVDWTTDDELSGYPAGDQTFYLQDHYGGKASVQVTFLEPAPLEVQYDNKQNVQCNGTNTGWLRYNISGGTYPFSFSGNHTEQLTTNGEDTLLTATQLYEGSYQYTIIDKHGCSVSTIQETITEPEELTIPYTNIIHTSCELDNGELHALANGGTEPYSYNWENLISSATFNHSNYTITDISKITDLPASSYIVEVIDNNGCTANSSQLDVNPYTNPSITNVQITDVRCYGESNGEIVITANGGTSNIQSYTLSANSSIYKDSSAVSTFTSLVTDTFQLYVFDSSGCRSNIPYPALVRQPDTVLYAIIDTIVPVISKGENTGRIYNTVYGGNDNLKTISLLDSDNAIIDQNFEPGQSRNNFNNLYAGTYSLQVIDRKGCTFNTPIQTVIEPETALGFNIIEKNDAQCKAQTGSFTIEGFGGWGEYAYKRAIDNNYYDFNTFSKLYAGNYVVSVQDRLGAIFTDTLVIYEPKDSLQASLIDFSDPTCDSNGSISLNLTGGVAPYKIFFENSSDTTDIATAQDITINDRPAGGYLLHVEDDNGCKFEMETNLSDDELIEIVDFYKTYPSNDGASDGSVEVLVKGGQSPLSFAWKELNGNDLTETSAVLSGIPSGHYEVTVSELDACSKTDRVYLPNISDQAINILSLQHETSYLAENGFAQLFSDLESLVNFEVINTEGVSTIYSITDSTADFYVKNANLYLRNLTGGNYFVMLTNSPGDKAYTEFDIEPYKQFYFESIQISHTKEIDDSSGTISVVVSGGAGENSFDWKYLDGVVTELDTANSEYASILNNAVAGNYSLTVTDKYFNSITQDTLIKQPNAPLDITIAGYRNERCKDYEDAYVIVQAAGGWGDYQFKQDIEEFYANDSTWLNLDVRKHYFYITDKMGAIDSVEINITEPEYLKANVDFIDSVDCKSANDGIIFFDVTGGTQPYRFAMLDDTTFWTKDTIVYNLEEGNYSFLFTDSNNCRGQDTIHTYMPEPDSLLFNTIDVTHTTCDTDNGTISVVMQGGTRPYQYEWTDFNGNTFGIENTVSELNQNGYYTLNVLDAHNCLQHFEQLISPSTNPIVVDIDTTPVLCYGGFTGTANIVDVTPAIPYAPYSFTWSNSDIGEFADGYNAGIHSVTISDTNNCSTLKYFEVTQPDTLQLVVTDFKDAHCFGYNDGFIELQALGGVGNYRFIWSNDETGERIDSLYTGTYSVTLTDSNNCSFQKVYEIFEPDKLIVDLGEDIRICPGNTIDIDGQNFSTHQWTNSEGVFSNERFVSLDSEDDYYLEVTDSIACFARDDISVSVGNDALQADFLISSEANLGDTLFIYELSNIKLDSLYWEYNQEAFNNIIDESIPNYMLQLKSIESGIYNVGLWAYSGGCISKTVKQVEIIEAGDTINNNDDYVGYVDPLIKELSVYPNPTDGNFMLKIELREIADIQLVVFSVNYGETIDLRNEFGQDYYEVYYQLTGMNSGIYVIMVTADNERKQIKIIIE